MNENYIIDQTSYRTNEGGMCGPGRKKNKIKFGTSCLLTETGNFKLQMNSSFKMNTTSMSTKFDHSLCTFMNN